MREALRAGVLPVMGPLPQPPQLRPPQAADIARWRSEIRPPSLGAGCTLLEADYAAPVPAVAREIRQAPPLPAVTPVPPAIRQGWDTAFPADLLNDPATQRYRLDRQGAEAEVRVRGAWTVLTAGSLLKADVLPSNQLCLSRKREDLRGQGLLQPFDDGRLQVMRHLALPSLVNTARLALGNNAGADVWQPV